MRNFLFLCILTTRLNTNLTTIFFLSILLNLFIKFKIFNISFFSLYVVVFRLPLPSLQLNEFNLEMLPFACPRCPKMYKQHFNLLRHLRLECGVERRFECHICKRRFCRQNQMKRHLMLVHPL